MVSQTVTVGDVPTDGLRLDRYVSEVLAICSRSQIKLRGMTATVNGASVRLSYRVKSGDSLTIQYREPEATQVQPEPVPLSIVYEDEDVVVIDKPSGMVVHPAKGNYSGTLVQGLIWHLGGRDTDIGPAGRPGVVHRLDKDTSGIIITAKHPDAQEFLARQFKQRTTVKHYLAVVKGRVTQATGTIRGAIGRDPHNRKRFAMVETGGRWSETSYRVLSRIGNFTFLRLVPKTGRTHQLRVHLQSIGHPIVGDPVYARSDPSLQDVGLALHAYRLEIELPGDRGRRHFRSPLPDRFKSLLRQIARLSAGYYG